MSQERTSSRAATTVAVASTKGGVGKTTISLNLAYALAKRGYRILLGDLDPQGAVGLSVGQSVSEAPGICGWVREGRGPVDGFLVHTRLPELSILPFGPCSWNEAQQVDHLAVHGVHRRLGQSFDVILWDTPAGLGGFTESALRHCEHVLLPVQAAPLAARALPQMMTYLGDLRRMGASVELTAVVLSMVNLREKASLAVAQEVWDLFPPSLVLDTMIPEDPAFRQASADAVPVSLMGRRPPAVAASFERMAAELEKKLHLGLDEHHGTPLRLVD